MDWSTTIAPCPSYVRLEPAKLQDLDGRTSQTQRWRPWPDAQNRTAHGDLVVGGLKLHHFLNHTAIQINAGSPDKPRTPEGQIPSYRSLTLRNLDIGLIYRDQPGLHMDHLWIGGGQDPSIRPDVTFEDLFLHDGNEGVMPVLFECGAAWDSVIVRRVATVNCAHPFMVKLDNTAIREFIIEDCPKLNICFQGWGEPLTVRVRNSAGIRLTTPRDNAGRPPNLTIVTEQDSLPQPLADVRSLLSQLGEVRQQEQAILDQLAAIANG
ncbi:MAG: hypothetical protein ACM359_07970 [Bacillota bacterium]